ncbi:hypothetical protein HIM_01073 [Hirsutella minnesotensis 3608]|nr:hypothetical protein HIM_01073 [Hirsutella minnesotensis 3608]
MPIGCKRLSMTLVNGVQLIVMGETGMARLALSEDDARVRRWFAEETQKLDCNITIDQMGNMFARRRGSLLSSAPMIAMGSHLDTQYSAGRYDGILGVVAALEALRTLHENNFRTQFDVGIVNWTNEEGARFPKSMVASVVWAGHIPLQEAWELRDIYDPSRSMRGELERIGYLGKTPCSSDAEHGFPLGAHFELHIEQGPILEEKGKKVGVVVGSQAYCWMTFTVSGRNAHTGTTPFSARRDPMLAAAEMIASSNKIASQHGALASTGVFKTLSPSSVNTLPSQVSFSLDIRHAQDSVVAKVQTQCIDAFRQIASKHGKGVEIEWTLDTESPSVKFDQRCVDVVRQAAESVIGSDGCLDMVSGAGHDSVYTSKRCPTAMIFVPCKDGVSHHPEEYCSPGDCATGTQVLLDSVLEYDAAISRKAKV